MEVNLFDIDNCGRYFTRAIPNRTPILLQWLASISIFNIFFSFFSAGHSYCFCTDIWFKGEKTFLFFSFVKFEWCAVIADWWYSFRLNILLNGFYLDWFLALTLQKKNIKIKEIRTYHFVCVGFLSYVPFLFEISLMCLDLRLLHSA